ncbi:SAF domain-containing protein [Microbacterium terricola]|uniref:Flagellar protein FlgA n=1 Tax=Microbacterium terricola TaxID=344163 RepID=A0ABM8DWT0_9MICO|nr:SAF domain-containing protein [Microbacterium terricola]UYK39197.1 SAF domain-containing protein [Microbacterium terricola]BDV30084.1 flagellar protein FlgA [Microbacterium terricola]
MSAVEPVPARSRAFWGDIRFVLGIVLIIVSIAGVWLVVSAARQTAPVYAAARTIVPGESVSTADLRVVEVALGQVGESYLSPDGFQEGAVATRTIESGELVPQSAVGAAQAATTTSVVIRSAVDVPASVGEGSTVEVWAAPAGEDGEYEAPRILVADVTVVSVTRDDSMLGGGAASLELVIPRAEVAAVLAAVADEAALSVVPAVGGAP